MEEIIGEDFKEIHMKEVVDTRVVFLWTITIRPVKIKRNSSVHMNQILRNSKLLHAKEEYFGIYLYPGRTTEQRKADKTLGSVQDNKKIGANKGSSFSEGQNCESP